MQTSRAKQQTLDSPQQLTSPQLFVHDATLYKELIDGIVYPDDYVDPNEEVYIPSPQKPSSVDQTLKPEKTNSAPLRKTSSGTSSTNNKNNTTRMETMKEEKKQQTEAYFQKIKDTTAKIRSKKQLESEKKFQELWNDILEERETFLKDINEKLAAYEEGDERKRQQIYEEWCERVFDPIQNQIDEHLAKLPFEEVKKKRRLKFEEYLNRLNHKHKNNGGVFRDIVLEDEYDPFELTKDTFKYKTKKPGETKMVSSNMRKQDMLGVEQYDKLDATPFGHYSKMVQPNSNSSKLAAIKLKSGVELDDFAREEKNPWENVRGKKVLQKIELKTTEQLANGYSTEAKRRAEAKRTVIPGAKK
ncbi:predicted protein [Naegleria gruberi]|uniref:Predicted protein n=1 Tax=Naegleria gruberi TaxID=5762 RepID=D2V7W5_NAEGR|nr:uncharacterized protein NAEGRDRAFT_47385 [Naegleria gruberi]EFC47076.1 predicted protein [Naegleria gruberi]|eukprot:XP_002679820.1 predicted protein [Naegleria gruberi strain NEG-M]